MTTNTKLYATVFAACLLSAATAQAQLNVSLGINEPGYVVAEPAPPPVYQRYPEYYDPHHHTNRDWRYWQERNHPHDRHDDRREWDHHR